MAAVVDRRGAGRVISGAARTAASRWTVVAVLIGGTALATLAPPAASAAPGSDSPLARAQLTGVPVELPEKTTESEKVFVNPDGSFTLEAHSMPVRARKAGAWVPIDTTLERSGTVVAPKSATVPLAFSGGGSDVPLARIAKGAWSLELTWPATLPSPTLVDDTATYPEVLPGVDLMLRATSAGFSEVLVVKTAQAASNPALRKVTFGVRASGLTLRARSGGGLTAVDRYGLPVFSTPKPAMWDSQGNVGLAPDPVPTDRARGPKDGDRIGPVGLEASQTTMSVAPDPALLTGSDTRYPLYIDPYLDPGKNAWNMVNQRYPNTEYYKWSGDAERAEGLGYITDSWDGWHRKRLMYRFVTSSINGTTILSATFKAFETHTYSCTKSAVDLWLLGALPSDTTWNNQPNWRRELTSRTVAYGRDGCSPSGAWVEFDAASGVREATSSGWTHTHLGMRAGSETLANTSWKRFRNDAVLTIHYNTTPTKPTGLRTESPTTSCATSTSPAVIPNDPPTLIAQMNDVDGAKGQTVKAQFELRKDGGTATTYNTALKVPGENVDYTWPLTSVAEATYSWRVRAVDYWDAAGPWSSWCYFRVDAQKPVAPIITVPEGQTYTHGQNATFTFAPGTSTDVTRYRWSLNYDEPTSGDVLPTAPTVTEPMRAFGPTEMRAWSYDAAGNISAPGSRRFTVAGGVPRTQWRMDEGDPSTTTKDAIYGDVLTLTDCSWVAGRWHGADPPDPTDKALGFNGGTSVAARTNGLMFMNRNFSVAGWVRATDVSARRVAISQDGYGGSGFSIGVQPDPVTGAPLYALTLGNPNVSIGATEAAATAPMDVEVGEWVHLTGVFEAGDHALKLYRNGVLVATENVEFNTVEPAGPFVIGRGRVGTRFDHFWKGDIDEVRTYNGALSYEQVFEIAREVRP